MTTTTAGFPATGERELTLSEHEATTRLETLPYPRVTKQAIEAKIASKAFFITEQFMTVCVITMRNGFEVIGENAPADRRNYDREMGKTFAYENAFRKLWPLEGYLLRDTIWKANQYLPEPFEAVTE